MRNRLPNIAIQVKEHLYNNAKVIISIMRDSIKCISDGRKEKDKMKVAAFSGVLLSIIAFLILVGLFIIKIIIQSRYILGAAVLFILSAYSIKSEEPKPTEKDYQDVLDTIRPSVAAVALPLNLAPIDSHTNMEVGPKDCIQRWKGGWRLLYKALKKNTAPVDVSLYQRTIQKAVEMTLNQANPAGFPEIQLKFGDRSFPIIVVDEVKDEDTYIYIYAAICTRKYIKQNFDNESNADPFPKADIDDEDFNDDNS